MTRLLNAASLYHGSGNFELWHAGVRVWPVDGSAPSEPQAPVGDYTLPTPTAEIDVTPGTLESVGQAAGTPPGAHLLMTGGPYNGTYNLTRGTAAQRLIVRPKVKTADIVFNNATRLEGANYDLWGSIINNKGSGIGTAMRIAGPRIRVVCCDVKAARIGLELYATNAVDVEIVRCHGYDQDAGSGNGGEFVKGGLSTLQDTDMRMVVRECLVEDYTIEREVISAKSAGMIIVDTVLRRCNQLVLRHANRCRIERCRSNDIIMAHGRGHVIRNVVAPRVEVPRGNYAGDTVVSGNVKPSPYVAGWDYIIQNVTGNLVVNEAPFSDGGPYNFAPAGVQYRGVSGTITNPGGIAVSTAPSYPVETPPNWAAADVGVAFYRSSVIGA